MNKWPSNELHLNFKSNTIAQYDAVYMGNESLPECQKTLDSSVSIGHEINFADL